MEDTYKLSMNFLDAVENGSEEDIKTAWHKAFNGILMSFGFDGNLTFFWNNLVAGNWKRLHLTADEEDLEPKEWLDKLYWEVLYCSDRWSLDRLMRCHWLYRVWQGEY